MATVLTMPSAGVAAVHPTPTGWGHVNNVSRTLRAIAAGTPLTALQYEPDGPAPAGAAHLVDTDAMCAQFVTGICPAQTIAAQLVVLAVSAYEMSANNNLYPSWKLYATNVAGTSVLGTLVALSRTTTYELGATPTGTIGVTDVRASTSFTGASPFRLVLEVGAGGLPVSSGRHDFGMWFGDFFTEGRMDLNSGSVFGFTGLQTIPMLVFSEDILPPVDDAGGGGTYGFGG